MERATELAKFFNIPTESIPTTGGSERVNLETMVQVIARARTHGEWCTFAASIGLPQRLLDHWAAKQKDAVIRCIIDESGQPRKGLSAPEA